MAINIKKNKENSNTMIGKVSPLFTRTNETKNLLLKTKNDVTISNLQSSLIEYVPPPPPGSNDDSCVRTKLNLLPIDTLTDNFCVEGSSNINTFQDNEEPPRAHVEQPISLGLLLSDTNRIFSDQQDFSASSQLLKSFTTPENPCYATVSWDQSDAYDHNVKDTSPRINDENAEILYACDSSKHGYTECQIPSSSVFMHSEIESKINKQSLNENDEPEEEFDNLSFDEETISVETNITNPNQEKLYNKEIEPRELLMFLNHESKYFYFLY